MALNQPDIIIVGKSVFGSTTTIDYFSSGSSIYDNTPLTYNAQFEIVSQTSGWPDNATNYNTFNANNIAVGWKFLLTTGKIYDVTGISVYSDTSASIDIRDTELRIWINSYTDPPSNFPDEDQYGIFIPAVNGIPKISNLFQNSGFFPAITYWSDEIIAESVAIIAESGSGGGSVTIDNNVDNYLITATGTANTLNGESSLRYDGTGLIIGATGSAQALLQISGSGDLLLIKNGSDNGIKVNSEGVLQFLSQSSTPTAVAGGIYYSGSAFYVGID
jgi:hypothetical protein